MCKRNPLCVHSQETGKDGPSGVVFTARELEKMAPREVPGWGITDPSLFCILGFVFLFSWNPGRPQSSACSSVMVVLVAVQESKILKYIILLLTREIRRTSITQRTLEEDYSVSWFLLFFSWEAEEGNVVSGSS